jgi:hypothetical protein
MQFSINLWKYIYNTGDLLLYMGIAFLQIAAYNENA